MGKRVFSIGKARDEMREHERERHEELYRWAVRKRGSKSPSVRGHCATCGVDERLFVPPEAGHLECKTCFIRRWGNEPRNPQPASPNVDVVSVNAPNEFDFEVF